MQLKGMWISRYSREGGATDPAKVALSVQSVSAAFATATLSCEIAVVLVQNSLTLQHLRMIEL
jgi:hypothetical protein